MRFIKVLLSKYAPYMQKQPFWRKNSKYAPNVRIECIFCVRRKPPNFCHPGVVQYLYTFVSIISCAGRCFEVHIELVFCTRASTGSLILQKWQCYVNAPAPVLEVLVMPAVVADLR